MAVGTIASLSVSASTTSIAISFAKPANCTKVIFTLTPKNPSGSTISKTYTLPAGSAGTQLTYNFTGLLSTQKYTLSATPYNGSTAGTARLYYNSNSSPVNSIVMPSAKITTPQTNTSYNPLTGTAGGTGGAVGTGSSTGSTANGGTIAAADAAGSNTPQFIAGVTDAVVPSDLNSPGRISFKVPDLAPNQTYAIKVRAYTTDAQGNQVHSEYSSPIYITTPGFSASGTNHLSTNNNGDLQLLGGSIFAGDFGSDAGLIDVVNGTTTGTGVILNQTGLAGFANGTKEFYINATTGKAYFAGTVTAGTVIIGPNINGTGKTGLYIDANNYWYSDGSFSATSKDIAGALTNQNSGNTLDVPDGVSNFTTAWSGSSFVASWTFDETTTKNKYAKNYIISFTAGGLTKTVTVPIAQKTYSLTLTQNRSLFGVSQTTFTAVSIIVEDRFGNQGSSVSASSIAAYVNLLPTPVITVTSALNGYSVAYTTPTDPNFNIISIEESSTQNGTYLPTYIGTLNPVVVIVPNTNARWVKARFTDQLGSYTSYSTSYQITPTNPVTVDTVGPADVTSVTTTGGIDTSGYMGFNAYADISWPAVSDSTLRGYRIRFSNDNGTTYSYVDSPGTGVKYRLGGLAVGATYKIAVATYDDYNNTSSNYISGADVTVTGTPAISNYITAGPFQFGVGVGSVSTNKGLYFDASNYWYINATNSARFNLGGSTSNYLNWDGSTFTVDGNIVARQGTFSGNVYIAAGGSLYSGTLGGGSGTSGFALNTSGLRFDYNGTTGITQIAAATGLLTTTSANIGGWSVDSSSISKTGSSGIIKLDSTNGKLYVQNAANTYTAGISNPELSSGNVFWAGAYGPSSTSNNFYVTQDGVLHASSAVVSGTITASSVYLDSNNKWDSTSFKITSGSTYFERTSSAITMYSGTTTSGSDTNSSPDGTGSSVSSISVTSQIQLTSSGLKLQGVSVLGDYTKYAGGGYLTNVDSNANNPVYGMGAAARARMLVQDPYDNTVYRGMAVYYGQRSSAPTGGTGYVGDLWVSW